MGDDDNEQEDLLREFLPGRRVEYLDFCMGFLAYGMRI